MHCIFLFLTISKLINKAKTITPLWRSKIDSVNINIMIADKTERAKLFLDFIKLYIKKMSNSIKKEIPIKP